MTRSLSETLGGTSPEQWAIDFLHAAGFAPSPANVQAVVSWEYAESSGGGGMFNPLNTTQGGYQGESNFNTVGVKNYRTYADGIAANAKVIHNGFYARVVAAFQRGNSARDICDLVTLSPWGTGPIALRGTPQPGTVDRRNEMQIIALGQKSTIKGRTPAAVWDSNHPNRVILTNDARLQGDSAGIPHTRIYTFPVPAGCTGIGIGATVDGKGRPDGRGIFLQDDHSDTYEALKP